MELALELVNHVTPDIADQLLAHLREAEVARQAAEDRCASLQSLVLRVQTSVGDAAPPLGEASPPGRRWAVSLAAAVWFAGILFPALVAIWFAPAWSPEGHCVPCAEMAAGNIVQQPGALAACLEAVQVVHAEAEELRVLHKERVTGYHKAMEGMSSWVNYLRDFGKATCEDALARVDSSSPARAFSPAAEQVRPRIAGGGTADPSCELRECLAAARQSLDAVAVLALESAYARGGEAARLRARASSLEDANVRLREAAPGYQASEA